MVRVQLLQVNTEPAPHAAGAGAEAESRAAMQLYHIDSIDPEAVCNDGSPGAHARSHSARLTSVRVSAGTSACVLHDIYDRACLFCPAPKRVRRCTSQRCMARAEQPARRKTC